MSSELDFDEGVVESSQNILLETDNGDPGKFDTLKASVLENEEALKLKKMQEASDHHMPGKTFLDVFLLFFSY